ncbi:MAG TPA: hydrogenase maturation protease [Myxococcaceae bacterium]|nr:hydrogenase maturation protease [Myxococcaceae bacterium]
MRTLVVGIGNAVRGDDGVGPFVIDLLRAARAGGLELRTAFTFLPELADELPGRDAVVFVDADVHVGEVMLRPLGTEGREGLHRFAPARVVALGRALGFRGQAWLCSVPVTSMEAGDGLSQEAVRAAGRAAAVLLGVDWSHSPGEPPVLQ